MFSAKEESARMKNSEVMERRYPIKPLEPKELDRLPKQREVGKERDRIFPFQEPFSLGELDQEGARTFFTLGGGGENEGHRFSLQKTEEGMALTCLDVSESVENRSVLLPRVRDAEIVISRVRGDKVSYGFSHRDEVPVWSYGLGEGLEGKRNGQEIDFEDITRLTLFEKRAVSGHARIIKNGERVFIRDEDSLNGTWVEKERGVEVVSLEEKEKPEIDEDWRQKVRDSLRKEIIPELRKEKPDAEFLFHTALDLLDFLAGLEKQEEVKQSTIDLLLRILVKYSNKEQRWEMIRRLVSA